MPVTCRRLSEWSTDAFRKGCRPPCGGGGGALSGRHARQWGATAFKLCVVEPALEHLTAADVEVSAALLEILPEIANSAVIVGHWHDDGVAVLPDAFKGRLLAVVQCLAGSALAD